MVISESILRSVVSESVNEYLDKNFGAPLRNYLRMTDDDKTYEKLRANSYYFPDFLDEWAAQHDFEIDQDTFHMIRGYADNYNWDGITAILEYVFGDEYWDVINDFLIEIDEYADVRPPTYDVMDYKRVVKNEWLVHFSDNAEDIARDGFRRATYDMDELGYSNAKEDEGYCFAFSADYVNDWNANKYGREAVLFRASGVEGYHYGDEEKQVIFYNNDAKDIVYLHHDSAYGEWYVESDITGNVIHSADRVADLIQWVIANFNQYRRHLLYRNESRVRHDNFKKSSYYNVQ